MAVEAIDLGLNCRDCNSRMQRERGCREKGNTPFYIDGKQIFRCPLKQVTVLSAQYIKAYGFYKNNILPNGLGWVHETDKFLTAMGIIEGKLAKLSQQKEKGKKHGNK